MEYESYFRLGSNKANFNSDVMIYEGIRIKKSDDTSTTNYKLNLKNHTLTLGEKRNGVIYIAGDIEGSEGSKIETNTVTQIRALVNVDIIQTPETLKLWNCQMKRCIFHNGIRMVIQLVLMVVI